MVTYRVITGGGQFIDSQVSVVMSSPILRQEGLEPQWRSARRLIDHLADIAPPRLE